MEEKIFGKICFSLEWKSEAMMDDDSGDSEEGEGEEDWLRQGWRSEAGSFFQRWGNNNNNKSSSGDGIPERDVTYHLLCLLIYHWTTTDL